MKLVTIVGARPQFIKAAAVSRKLRIENEEILVHTGQHYDEVMSDIFFEELDIPKPDYNLGVGSGSHGQQTANMLIGIEEILLKEKPDCILVYGDTNSTLAGALAASKLLIPVVHVEAGLRSYNLNMPEEQNRVLTDHISELLCCPTKTAVECLKREGIEKNVYLIGDVMCDAVFYYFKRMERKSSSEILKHLIELDGKHSIEALEEWYLTTIHRAENTDSLEKIEEILEALEQLDAPALFPVHPRTKKLVEQAKKINNYSNTFFIEPVGYLDMLYLTSHAKKVITDSGGLQKEAYMLHTPCITVREQTEWVETLKGNHNVLARLKKEDIIKKVLENKIEEFYEQYYGIGNAAEKLSQILKEQIK